MKVKVWPHEQTDVDRRRALVERARTMSGEPLAPEHQEALLDLMHDPTEARWEECHGLILHPRAVTLWQVVSLITDRNAEPRIKGPVYEGPPNYKQISGWSRIPTGRTVERAIAYAVS